MKSSPKQLFKTAGWAILLLEIHQFILDNEKMLSCLSQKRGTARDSTGFERHPLAVLILRRTGGLFFSIVKKILTKTFLFPFFIKKVS